MFALIARERAKLPASQRFVVVSDWRRCPIMSEAASERTLTLLTLSNPTVERSAALPSNESPLAVLQFMRLIRESHHPERRLFHAPSELLEWLAPSLTEPENARLSVFLSEPLETSTEAERAR